MVLQGCFLAAAPTMPSDAGRGTWAFPTATSAAWVSGHGWALLFTQQQQYDAFNSELLPLSPAGLVPPITPQ